MSGSDVGALVVAAVANAAGIAVAVVMWRRGRRRRRALHSRHPSVRPPLRVDLADVGGARRIRLAVPSGAPALTVDIVTFRRHDASRPWESEPLDRPLELAPGSQAVLASTLDSETSVVDVVVAWTVRDEGGPAPGSHLFRLPPERAEPDSTRFPAGLAGRATLALAALLLASGALVAFALMDDGPSSGSAGAPEPGPATTRPPSGSAVPTAADATTPATVAPPATAPPTDDPAPSDPTTSSPTSSAPPTTDTGTTTTVAAAPRVDAAGRIEPCRFGDECLVVGFTISGFEGSPTEYVCEFDDGSRFTFTFVGGGADTACATGAPNATIVVEVAGVRSDTITRP